MDTFRRYLWLARLLYESRQGLSRAEIQERWERYSDGELLPDRTFARHKEKVEEIFGVDIVYNTYSNRYVMENPNVIANGVLQQWLFETFSVEQELREASSLSGRILPEEIPQGREYFFEVIRAMRQNHRVKIRYQSHYHTDERDYLYEPYCLKAFKQRWYMHGREVNYDYELTLALERIIDLELTDEKYQIPKGFDARERYADVYGITVYEDEPARLIRFKAYDEQGKYIKSLPIHHSQRVIEEGNGYIMFELFLRPSFELYKEFLSYGKQLEILSPAEVKKEVDDMR